MAMFNSFIDTVSDKIGNLNAATTTDKSSVVAMVNEVNGKIAFPTLSTGNPADIKGLNIQVSKSNNYMIITLLTTTPTSDADKVTIEWDGNNDVVRFRNYINNVKVKEATFMSSDEKQAAVSKVDTYASGASWGITKQLNLCVLRLINIKDLPNGRTLVGTIPVGYRPQNEFYEYVYGANNNTHIGFIFATNGEITAINNTGSTISGEIYVNRNVTYFTA